MASVSAITSGCSGLRTCATASGTRLASWQTSISARSRAELLTSLRQHSARQRLQREHLAALLRSDRDARSGQGLLTGLLRCARCGRKLHIRYWGKHGTAARYLCSGDFETGGSYCLGFGGASVDRRLSELILKIISPHGLEACIAAIAQSRSQGSEQRAALERQLQQARYEAERAFAQYDQADPCNRLVAKVLEQRWNTRLAEQQRIVQALSSLDDATVALTPADEATLRALGEDFAIVWNSDACPMALKKRIARTLIKEIVVDVADAQQLNLVIHWQGGCHTAFSMPKPQSGAVAHKTALEDVELIMTMARR